MDGYKGRMYNAFDRFIPAVVMVTAFGLLCMYNNKNNEIANNTNTLDQRPAMEAILEERIKVYTNSVPAKLPRDKNRFDGLDRNILPDNYRGTSGKLRDV